MPSNEELQAEFKERFTLFQRLMSEQRYHQVILYFRDTLKNCRVIRPEYIYFLAYAYLMIEDYEHGEILVEDLFDLNMSPDSAKEFINIFIAKKQFYKAFNVIEKILGRVQITDKDFQANLKNFIQQNNLQIEKYPRICKFIME